MLYPDSCYNRRQGGPDSGPAEQSKYRTPFDRDYARILHSPAFRRLAGKTQLFPSDENDFFRNRLTHSLEVAQVASTVARRLNKLEPVYEADPIDPRLCELAALAHDIGHPPFGHNGEEALNALMNGSGGFEGNAQTIRIVSKLEKKEYLGDNPKDLLSLGKKNVLSDRRMGLDLCARSLAAMLKYDNLISPSKSPTASVQKGYYYDDESVIDFIKENVGDPGDQPFRTIECSIMDISDDIAYSTYDLEDAFKGGFLNPLRMISAETDFKNDVAETVKTRAKRYYPEREKDWASFSAADVDSILLEVFKDVIDVDIKDPTAFDSLDFLGQVRDVATHVHVESRLWADNGYYRINFTSRLISRFVNGIELQKLGDNPIFWNARLGFYDFLFVETLKTFAFKSLIMSSFLRVSEYRGRDMINDIYDALMAKGGSEMLPADIKDLCRMVGDTPHKHRVVCDFIASMTDRYAIEFHRRLIGSNAPSIFKPH